MDFVRRQFDSQENISDLRAVPVSQYEAVASFQQDEQVAAGMFSIGILLGNRSDLTGTGDGVAADRDDCSFFFHQRMTPLPAAQIFP